MTVKPRNTSIVIPKSFVKEFQLSQLLNNLLHNPGYWLKLFLKTSSVVGLGLFLLGIVGIGFARSWAKDHLAPIVAKELSKTLKRPVNLGEIEDIWFDRIQINNAFIPTHSDDFNQLKVREVIITFSPLDLLLKQSVKLDIEIAAPDIYLAQNVRGNWLNISPQPKSSPSPIKVELGTINIENARIVVLPYSKNPQPVTINKINLQADIDDNQQQVKFNGGGQFGDSGQVRIQGNSLIANGKTELVVNGTKLDAAAATRVVKIPEVQIDRGTVDGNLSLAIEQSIAQLFIG